MKFERPVSLLKSLLKGLITDLRVCCFLCVSTGLIRAISLCTKSSLLLFVTRSFFLPAGLALAAASRAIADGGLASSSCSSVSPLSLSKDLICFGDGFGGS